MTERPGGEMNSSAIVKTSRIPDDREQRGRVGGAVRERQEEQERDAHDDRTERELDRRRRLTRTELRPDRREDARQDDDEDRVDRVDPRDGHLPAEDVPVEPLVGVDREHRELLLVERPEPDVHDEERDEAHDPRAIGRRDVPRRDDDGEVGDRRDRRDEDDDSGEVVGTDDAEQHERDDAGEPRQADPDEDAVAVSGEWVGDDAGGRRAAACDRTSTGCRPIVIPTAAAAKPTWKPYVL